MNLIQLGRVILSSGTESDFKLECDQFIEENIDGLAFLIRRLVGPFSSVYGVPRGGLNLAYALKPFASASGPTLLVDDVLTTGGSMVRYSQGIPESRAIGAVVFARGCCPHWIKAVFQLPEELWLKPTKEGTSSP